MVKTLACEATNLSSTLSFPLPVSIHGSGVTKTGNKDK